MWTPDGDTLGDSPITVSGNNATFANDVTIGDDLNISGEQLTFTNDSASAYLRAADALLIQSDYNTGENKPIYLQPSAVTELTIATGVSTFAGSVGVGTSSASSFYPGTNNLVVGDGGGEHAVTVYSGATSTGYLLFADGSSSSDRYAGQVRYNHSTNAMEFAVNNSSTAKLTINSSGNATFEGNVTTNGYLTLTGQATPQLFMQSNTSGTPNWTLIAGTNGTFTIGRAGVANDLIF